MRESQSEFLRDGGSLEGYILLLRAVSRLSDSSLYIQTDQGEIRGGS